MTVFTDWANSRLDWDAYPYERCSDNLGALGVFLKMAWPKGQHLGCHGDRPIREGSKPSSHSYGAAYDWGHLDRDTMLHVMDFLIWVSPRTGIQAIHDYYGDRIWRCNRNPEEYPDGWKKQNGAGGGMGEEWATYIHVETNFNYWFTRPNYQSLYKEYCEVTMTPYRLRAYGTANQVLVDGGMSPISPDTLAMFPEIDTLPILVTQHAATKRAIQAFYGGTLEPHKEI